MSSLKEISVGEFLNSKVINLLTWLQTENIISSLELHEAKAACTPLRCVVLAQQLQQHKACIIHRDWLAFVQTDEVPEVMKVAVAKIRQNPDLHDKFWRYMQLFVDVAEEA